MSPSPYPHVTFLGAGNMGEAMLRGLRAAGFPGGALAAVEPKADRRQRLEAELGIRTAAEPAGVLPGAAWVVLAVKPQVFPELLPTLPGLLGPDQKVLSVAAGVTLRRLEGALGAGRAIVRVMPNTPGLIGQGVSAYCLGAGADEAAAREAERLLAPLGAVLRVPEASMDAVTALSGSGPAYVFLLLEALADAGADLGLPRAQAEDLAARTVAGAAAMVLQGRGEPAALRAAVTSPGGTTAAALKVFEDGGFRDLVRRALGAARDRSRELGASPPAGGR